VSRPLEGVRVLDLTRLLPGPFATLVLADLGADVVKIEAPNVGDYMRAMPPARGGVSGAFWTINRDKRSAVLDLKKPGGAATFLSLVEGADVVIESFRPGVMDRLGVGYEALRARNPKIILCSISGYGQTGPMRGRAGHDINYLGLGGVLAMGGERDGAPAIPGVQIADLAGGALWAVSGICAALFGRDKTGEGEHIDISMTEGAMALLAPHFGYLDAGAGDLTRGRNLLNGGWACYGVYRTADDRWLSVGAIEPKFWLAFNAAIGREASLADLGPDPEVQERVRGELAEIISAKTRDEWAELLAGVDCCVEPIYEADEIAGHPLHQAREVFFTQTDERAGEIAAMRMPIGEPAGSRIAPRLGEHTDEVLAEYGVDRDDD
jgi:crotonobetainyl-CoA:carnitine CoA-transferase CaiB-like acyl-CoA transferase